MAINIHKYIIRVYGLIINSKNEILISDEFQLNMRMTKFPGGGMEFGEGPVDCLKREAIEELGQEIEVLDHFYTTDYFQPAYFYDDSQLISVYYFARFKEPVKFKISDKPFDFEQDRNGNQSFRWESIKKIKPEDFSFPVDQKVVGLLKAHYGFTD